MKTYKLTFLMLGSVIGAGFATGKELQVFFVRYGVYSYVFDSIFCVLVAISNYLFLLYGKEHLINNISVFTRGIFHKSNNVIDIIFIASYLIVIGGMFGAISEVTQLIYGYDNVLIIFLFAVITYFVVIIGARGLEKINAILTPIIIIVLIHCSISNLSVQIDVSYVNIFSPFCYAGLNVIFGSFALMCFGVEHDKTVIKRASVISSIILFLLIVFATISLSNVHSTMPYVAIALNISQTFSIIMCIMMLFAIITTITSSVYAISIWYDKKYKKRNTIVAIIISLVISRFRFANIVEYAYPLIGAVGMILLIYIVTVTRYKKL